MTLLFVLVAATLVLVASAVVILPLTRAAPAPEGEKGGERLAVLAHGMRELDAELEAGTLDRGEYEEAKRELERQALEADATPRNRAVRGGRSGWVAALVAGIALPLLAVVLYVALGQPAALSGRVNAVAHAGDGSDSAELAAMTRMLARRLKQSGGDAQGWLLLARSYRSIGRLQDAVSAYRKVAALTPDNADLLVEYANTLSVSRSRNLAGEPSQLIERALKIDPDNLNALALAGAAALQAGKRADAVRDWTHLKSLIPADSPDRLRVEALIARAQGKRPPAVPGAAIHGTVTMSDALAGKISPADTLFIFARAPDGPPMPLAVVRRPAAGFPAKFTLDDSRAMAPGLHLSQFPSVSIVARISRNGSANVQPGDLEGRIDGVSVGSGNVRVVIDHMVGP